MIMLPGARFTRCLLLSLLAGLLQNGPVMAQEAVLVRCSSVSNCVFHPAFSVTIEGKDSVKLVSHTSAGAEALKRGRTAKLKSIGTIYRDPGTNLVRILDANGHLGLSVIPSRLPKGVTSVASAVANTRIDFRETAKGRPISAPFSDVVALIRDVPLSRGVVEFLKHVSQADSPDPMLEAVVRAAVAHVGTTNEMAGWRAEIRAAMQRSLDEFLKQQGDPAGLEAVLERGVAAVRIHRMVAIDPEEGIEFQRQLLAEHRRLHDRFIVASVLRSAGEHDAYLEKLSQIGLARWSRYELAAGADESLASSAAYHFERARQRFESGQYGGAFDEARLASTRAPCDESINDYYYRTRVEFVNRTMVPTSTAPVTPNRSILEQIVRELEGIGSETGLTPERIEHVRKRLAEGERLDKDYLPLQLKKSEFLANLGELAASRDVVTRIERTVRLGRAEADDWLHMDASLNGRLPTLRQRTERLVTERIASGDFRGALETAAPGLAAEPNNTRFLYLSAVSAAVIRDNEKARHFIQRFFRALETGCSVDPDARSTLLEIYRRPAFDSLPRAGGVPNWISGAFYPAGAASYDPISGSFNHRVLSSTVLEPENTTSTDIRWEGYLAASIRTTVATPVGERQTVLELEPLYVPSRVHMIGIGPRANSEGHRKVLGLRYLNSPEFDPVLAARFTKRSWTRGWSGNPFFHPFLWNDLYLFDLTYDARGRIERATPVPPDTPRPVSSFSEPLTFVWDGDSQRLLSISGQKYRRDLIYNGAGDLVEEKVKHPSGKGRIRYEYKGSKLIGIVCEDDFYDKGRRRVLIYPQEW